MTTKPFVAWIAGWLVSVGCLAGPIAPHLQGQEGKGEGPLGPWQWQPLRGEPFLGTVVGLADSGAALVIRDAASQERAVGLSDLDGGQPAEAGGRAAPGVGAGRLWLRDASVVPWTDLRSPTEGDQGVVVEHPCFDGPVRIRWDDVSGLAAAEVPEGYPEALRSARSDRSLLFARGSKGVQRLGVDVLGIAEQGIVMSFQGRERPPLSWDRVLGLVLPRSGQPALGEQPQKVDGEPGLVVRLLLRGGGVLRGRLVDWANRRIRLEAPAYGQVTVHLRAVSRMEVVSGQRVWLSSLQPDSVEQQAALEKTWPWWVDRAPNGPGIRLGGRGWSRGLVLIPRTRIEFDLEGRGFRTFRGVLGIDERAGSAGHAILRVLGDGKVLFSTGPFAAGSLPRKVELEIEGVKRLALEADFGERLDFGDHCAFAGAALLR